MALIAIGDVHGCAYTLDELLDALGPTGEDHLVFVGDYVDRGPRTRETVERLIQLQSAGSIGDGPRCTFLRGNHDQMMLDWIDHGEIDLWRANGGLTTLASYAEPSGSIAIPDDHVQFLRRTVLYLDVEDYCFVHAGLKPDSTVAENLQYGTADIFLWTRAHFGVRRRWEKTVVCGHTPQADVLIEADLIDIDTGCCFDHPHLGNLSAIQLPELTVTMVPNAE